MTGLLKRFFSTEIPHPAVFPDAAEAVGEEDTDEFATPPSVEQFEPPAPTLSDVVHNELDELHQLDEVSAVLDETVAATYESLYCDYLLLASVIEDEIAAFAEEKYAELAALEASVEQVEALAVAVRAGTRQVNRRTSKRRKALEALL